MAQAVPFSALLDVLRARGLEIGLIEYRDLALLLSRYPGQSREELRSAIAALFARDTVERQLIVDCFDELFPGECVTEAGTEDGRRAEAATDGAEPVFVRGGTPWSRRRRRLAEIAAVIVVALLVPAAIAWKYRPVPVKEVVTVDDPNPNPTEPRPPQPSPPPAPRKSQRGLVVIPALVSLGTLLALATAYRSASGRSRWLRAVRRDNLTRLSGPRFYRWPVDHRAMAVPRQVVEEVASILGRRHQVAETSNHLDVEQTLRQTLQAGLFPTIVFEPPCRTLPILVLHDIGPDMRPWRSRIDLLLRDLSRLGIPVRRFYFDASAGTLWRGDNEPTTTLEELSCSDDDAALLVISAGSGVATGLAEEHDSWLRLLEKWRSRTWLTPLTSRAHWRPELTRLPMSVWPMTPGGLNAAARELLFDDTHRPTASASAIAGARAVTADDLERVKRLAAIVPQPAPVEVVDALRARYTPDVPSDVLLPLLAQNTVLDSAHVRLPDAEVARLLAGLRRDDPDREIAVRRFLLELLASSEPPPGTAARLRWETDVALQHAQVAELAGSDARVPLSTLQTLAAGPLADEVTGRARAAAASTDLQSTLETTAKTSIVTTGDDPPAAPPRMSPPRFTDFMRAAAVTAAAVAVFVGVGGARSESVPHVENAFALRWDAQRGRLVMSVTPEGRQLPLGDRTLTKGDEPVAGFEWHTTERDFTPPRDAAGAWYRVQASLPDRNYALSNAEWVPGRAAANGMVDIKADRSDGPVDVMNGDRWAYSWRSRGMTDCTLASPSGQSRVALTGNGGWIEPGHPWYPKPGRSITLTLSCRNGSTSVNDSVTVNVVLSNVLTVTLTNVYGTQLSSVKGMLTVRDKTGAVVAAEQITEATVGSLVEGSPPPYNVRVEAPGYETATFAVNPAAAAKPIVRSLIMAPSRVAPDFTNVPRRVDKVQIPFREPQADVNAINILQRAQRTIVSVERPQGTWSQSLLDTIQTIAQAGDGIVATLEPNAAPYVERWIDLTARGRAPKTNAPRARYEDAAAASGPHETEQAAAPPPGTKPQSGASGQLLNRVAIRSGRTILNLELQSGFAAQTIRQSASRSLLRMSLSRAGGGDAHPYTIHQLLVQDGFPVELFRLRERAPAAAR